MTEHPIMPITVYPLNFTKAVIYLLVLIKVVNPIGVLIDVLRRTAGLLWSSVRNKNPHCIQHTVIISSDTAAGNCFKTIKNNVGGMAQW